MSLYDVAVIGAGLPGLTTAVFLARANRRVLVLDPQGLPGGVLASRNFNGIHFASGPFIAHGFEPGGPLRLLYAELGIPLSADMVPATYQVALPDRRITVHPDRSSTLDELRREFPGEIDNITSLYRDLAERSARNVKGRIYSSIDQWRSASAYLISRNASSGILSFFDVQARFFFDRPLMRLSLADLCALVAHAPVHLPQGFHGLAGQLLNCMTSLGGEFRETNGWPEVLVRSRSGFSLSAGEESVKARAVIINASYCEQTTVFLSMRSDGLPVGMESTVLCLSGYRSPEHIMVISRLPAVETSEQPPEGQIAALTITFLAQPDASLSSEERLARIHTMMPFADAHVMAAGETEQGWRNYPYSGPWDTALRLTAEGSPVRTVKSAGRLYVLRDRGIAVNGSVKTARKLSGKLGR